MRRAAVAFVAAAFRGGRLLQPNNNLHRAPLTSASWVLLARYGARDLTFPNGGSICPELKARPQVHESRGLHFTEKKWLTNLFGALRTRNSFKI
jgi:hypothetical protein